VNEGDSSALQHQVTLVELVDRVLNRGVVLSGDITLSVAGVDLVYVGLRLLLASVGTLERLEQEASGNGKVLAAGGTER
jgi:gas vesicle structural protein